MGEFVYRFLIGGAVVSAFAVLGDIFQPKTFSGLFAAAPSVALGSLALAITSHGGQYGMTEGRSMIIGAMALFVYSLVVAFLAKRLHWPALQASVAAVGIWLAVAVGGWLLAGGNGS